MTLENATQIVLDYLKEHKKAKNSVLISLIDHDTDLFEEVKEELIFEDLAEDKKGVGLLYIGEDSNDSKQSEPIKLKEPLRIFLSYGHDANEELVLKIKVDLEKRGHDVWFDKNEIKYGDDWRHAITEGIVKSNKVLAFLSQHSTRNPGVCLDEIGIALGAKGGNIQTILVENESEVSPPPTVSHMQWLDMQEWKRLKEEGNDSWEKWYGEKFNEIVQVIESEENRRFAGEIEKLNALLTPISSDARVASLLERGFIGRKWLLEELQDWYEGDEGSRAFWIVGQPGVGKSALAAEIVHRNKQNIIAAQFCEWNKPNHRDARQVIKSIAFQIATRLSDYRKYLLTLPELDKLNDRNESELFDYLLANPLTSVIDGGRQKFLILIDALDEAADEAGNPLVEMLAREMLKLPKWFGFIFTSRPESSVTTPLQWLNATILETNTDNNRKDIIEYINYHLKHKLEDIQNADEVIESILEKSEGVFLYVEQLCMAIKEGYLSLEQPEQFPSGVGGIYLQYFKRQFPDIDQYRKSYRSILGVILAAYEPLPLTLLQDLFQQNPEQLHDITLKFGVLFSVFNDNGTRKIRPYHKTINDWLCNTNSAGSYYVSTEEGHKQLARYGYMLFEGNTKTLNGYILTNLPEHLYYLKQWRKLAIYICTPKIFIRLNNLIKLMLRKYFLSVRSQYSIPVLFLSHIPKENKNNWMNYNSMGLFCNKYLPEEIDFVLTCHTRALSIASKQWGIDNQNTAISYNNLGRSYKSKGNIEQCEKYYLKALEIREKVLGIEHPDTAVSYSNLGGLYKDKGNLEQSEKYYLKALEIHEKVLGIEHPNTAISYGNLGGLYKDKGNLEQSEKFYLKAVEIHEKVLGIEHPDTATSYNNLGGLYKDIGNIEQSEKFYLKALEIREKVLGLEHPDTATSYNNLGGLYRSTGNKEQSEKFYLKALEIRENVLGLEHPNTAISYGNLGGLYKDKGNIEQCEKYYLKALEIREKVLGLEHPDTATSYNNLGGLYKDIGNIEQSEKFYLKALEIREKVLGLEHPDTATSYNNLGGLYRSTGNKEQSEKFYLKALEIRENVLGLEHPNTAISYGNLGGLYKDKGNIEQCEKYYLKALEIREKVLGLEHPDTATSYNNLGGLYKDIGNIEQSEKFYLKALEIREKVLGLEHPDTATSYNNLGGLYRAKCDYGQAEKYYLKALENRKKTLGMNHLNTALTYSLLGGLYRDIRKLDQSEKCFLKALEIHIKVLGLEHPNTAISYNNLGGLYRAKRDYEQAEKYYLKALENRKKTLGMNHLNTALTYSLLGVLYHEIHKLDQSEKYFLKALEIRERVLGLGHQVTATSYNNLGLLYKAKGNLDQSEKYYLKGMNIQEKVLGFNHQDTGTSYNNLGLLYHDKGNLEQSEKYYLKAIDILGLKHRYTARIYYELGSLYHEKGDWAKAEEYYLLALNITEKKYGVGHQTTKFICYDLGRLYLDDGVYEQAEKYLLQARDGLEKVFGTNNEDTANCYLMLSILYHNLENFKESQQFYIKTINMHKKIYGLKHEYTANCLFQAGQLHSYFEDYKNADLYFKKAIYISEAIKQPQAIYYENEGYVLTELNRLEDANVCFKTAYMLAEKQYEYSLEYAILDIKYQEFLFRSTGKASVETIKNAISVFKEENNESYLDWGYALLNEMGIEN